ncbi:MAG: NADH:ubiquinone reductase (Na(+)-transporting) subunit B [Calditrichaeota bacterium]|nr:MAG: NADH:ubiquinone reductase (Na(+)-transporting) subunit B [Calditrichota bacterium]MBL1206839.1 NADH:ubiquinone reductase (Na(+)-transporting) subunit B [Calditrichota bacterium]NOG46666.1 NADH:ubiquinone reductase (Na(+)-transporting) subunit B [Calditrichota bacterium]
MKFLHDLIEKQKPLFDKGGKLEKYFPIFEMTETILFWTNARTKSGPHIRGGLDTKRYMMMVVVALLPMTLFGMYNTGLQHFQAVGEVASFMDAFMFGFWQVLPLIIVSYAVGGFWEVLFAIIRKHEVNEGFLVTGLLFPLILPATMPLWQAAIGISFGVVIGKEVFGGTGMNILNPALTGRAFLFFAYPGKISGDKVWIAIDSAKDKVIDGFSGATPLLAATSAEGNQSAATAVSEAGFSVMDMFYGFVPGSWGETSVLAALIGAAILIVTGVGSWRIMLSVVLGGMAMGTLMNMLAGEGSSPILSLPAYMHLLMGGFALGTVFMATDPVSAAQTSTGKWIYGFLIGLLAVLIRAVNPAYPEGMMLAILFMNVFAPLIDYFVVQANIKRRLSRA